MAQQRSKCTFCGQAGASTEHIIARWIGRSMRSAVTDPGATVSFRHRSANPEAGIGVTEKSAKGTAFTTRAFCTNCNSWMGELEDEVKPVLEPMLHGRPVLLDERRRKLLAVWVTKTVLAFQAVEAEQTTFARPEDFELFHDTRTVLPGSEVWLGAVASGDEMLYRAHVARRNTAGTGADHGFGATLVVGYAAFYLLHGYERPFGLRMSHAVSADLPRIHPPRVGAQSWPPAHPIDVSRETGLTELIVNNSILSR